MSIRKMTFSLASLIFLIALGLVFVPTAVMAHTVTADNTGNGEPHAVGTAVGTAHSHPEIMVTIADADPTTMGIQVVDTKADETATALDFSAAVTPTLQFDVTLTVPVGAEHDAAGTAVSAGTFATADVPIVAYKSDFTAVGQSIAFDDFAQDDATDAPREWTATATLTLAEVAAVTTATGANAATENAKLTEAAYNKAVADAIAAGIMVDITLNADLIQMTGLVGGPMLGHSNLESKITLTVIAATVTNQRPTLTITTDVPEDAVTDSSFDIEYTTADTESDAVTVAATHAVVPTGAMDHYTVDDSVTGTVTVTQATPDATTATIPAASVTVTITPSDDGGAGMAQMFTVFFAAATYAAPNERPSATISTTEPTDAVTTGSFAIMYSTMDAESDDVMAAVTHSVSPTGAAAHYTVDSATAGTVTVTQAAPTATMMTIPAATVMVTITPSDDGGAGMAQTISVAFAARSYADPSANMLANNAHAVVVRSKSAAMASGYFGTATPTLIEWAAMPNLHQLFIQNTAPGGGGSLQMMAKDAAGAALGARKVVFSEVMWAIDEGRAGAATDDDDQWFEIYNRSGAAIPIDPMNLSFATQEGRPALPQGTDLVSNVVGGGDQWIRTKGQNGNRGSTANGVTTGQKEFISMYRHRYHNDSAGWNGGEWRKSTQLYKPNHRGTPGMQEAAGARTFTASGVALTVVFNEIANYPTTNKDYEWIELRTRSGDPHFENWHVRIVTGADDRAHSANPTQEKLFRLPKLDRARFDDILLITKTDPAKDPKHPLAAGYNVEVADADQARQGRDKNIRYYVADDGDHAWTKDLPDDGKFVLILRSGDKQNHEQVQDLAGFHPNLRVDKSDFFSNLWPLIGYPAPNRTNNKIEDGEVARRVFDDIPGTQTKDADKIDKVAFRHDNNHWTGIGYKRNLGDTARSPGAEYGGTPGYPNNAERAGNDAAALAAVKVTEIMPSQGARNLSEWIELRNISDTIGVNVNGWRITIQNHDEDGNGGMFDGELSEVITLSGNARIPPGQALLIAARGGRDETKLPSDRIKIVGKKRTEVLINPYGFTIKVESKKDNNYHLVDMVGNLGTTTSTRPNAASLLPIAWELPATTNEDGDRVSIIRVSNKTTGVIDGTMRDGWASFEGSAQEAGTLDKTYYGHSTDLGSPGHTIGGVLPVSLSKFRPERMKDTGQVVIRWVTESELNNAGFNILRGEKLDGEFTKVNTKLIAGQGTTSERTAYTYTDTSAKPNVVYYYQIQDVSLDGQVTTLRTTHLRGNVTAVGKATTTWGDIKALQ